MKQGILDELHLKMERMPKHAPWNTLSFKTKSKPSINANSIGYDRILDLSVSDDVFLQYLTAYRASQTSFLLKKDAPPEVVSLILETEAGIWTACGGTATNLANSTWLTRSNAIAVTKKASVGESLRTLFKAFLDSSDISKEHKKELQKISHIA